MDQREHSLFGMSPLLLHTAKLLPLCPESKTRLVEGILDNWSVSTQTCDLIENGCFTNYTGSTQTPSSPFYPPSIVDDWNGAFGSPEAYQNFVWARMWGRCDPDGVRAEGIYQQFSQQFPPGNTYTLKLTYHTDNTTPDNIMVWLTDNNWSPVPTVQGASKIIDFDSGPPAAWIWAFNINHQDICFGNPITGPQSSFTQVQRTFIVDQNYPYYRLLIFPLEDPPNYPVAVWLYVECIELVPAETVTITSNPCPTIIKGNSIQLTANLSGSYIGSYHWSDNSVTQSINVSPTVTTTYSVTVTYANNCTATDQIQVIVVDASPDKYICSGQNVQIGTISLPNFSYNWSPVTFLSCTTCSNPWVVNPSVTTTYTVTVTNLLTQCSATDNVVVYVTSSSFNPAEPIPYINASSPSNNTCLGTTISYSIANPQQNHEYTWEIIPSNAGTITSPVAPSPVTSNNVTIQWTNIPISGAKIHVVGFNKKNCDTNYYYYTIFDCCTDFNPDYIFNDVNISAATQTTHFINKTIDINGTLTIDDNIIFEHCQVFLGADAKIDIQSGFTLEINNLSLLMSCDRYNMWDGIYLYDQNTFLIIDESIITEAKNAIVSENEGEFQIRGSTFVENYKNIILKACGQIYTGYITNTEFSSQQLIAPYTGRRGYIGIECIDVNYVVIGDSINQDQNIFKNLDYGIYSSNSYIRVVNNTFEDIEYEQALTFPIQAGDFIPIAICSESTGGGTKAYIGGDNSGGYYKSNYFEDCEMGVYTYNNEFVAIAGNEFNYTNQDNGFHQAILTESSTQTNYPHKIVGNTINSYRMGIKCVNELEAKIACNEIHDVKNPSTSLPYDDSYGISTYACSDSINYNIVDGNTNLNLEVWGISIHINDPTVIRCNDIDKVGIAFLAGGNNGDCSYQTDYAKDVGVALYLHQSTGYIGPQGGPNNPCDINFIGTGTPASFFYCDTYNWQSDGTQSPLYVRQNPAYPYQPSVNWAGGNGNAFTINTTGGSGISFNPNYCNDQITQYFSMNPFSNSLTNPTVNNDLLYSLSPAKIAQFIKIINDSIPFTSFVPESRWLSKYHLYNYIRKNNLNLGTVCNNFMTASLNNSIGKTNRVHCLIDSNNYVLAASVNNSIVCTNKVDSSYKFFNGLYLDKIAGQSEIVFDSTEWVQLVELAQQCPYVYGSAVYSARLTLQKAGDNTHYHNNCESMHEMNNLKGQWYTDKDENYVYNTKIYPNPANASVTVESVIPEGRTGKFLVMNLLGESILEYDLHEGINNLNISTKTLSAGLYLWKVEINGNNKETGKLLINK